jgi:hypothetical protein
MLRNWLRNMFLMALGKNPYPPAPSIYAVMFDDPHLTPRQAYWKVNGKRIILRWIKRVVFAALVLALLYYWKGG